MEMKIRQRAIEIGKTPYGRILAKILREKRAMFSFL
jgi:hypothetical protein